MMEGKALDILRRMNEYWRNGTSVVSGSHLVREAQELLGEDEAEKDFGYGAARNAAYANVRDTFKS